MDIEAAINTPNDTWLSKHCAESLHECVYTPDLESILGNDRDEMSHKNRILICFPNRLDLYASAFALEQSLRFAAQLMLAWKFSQRYNAGLFLSPTSMSGDSDLNSGKNQNKLLELSDKVMESIFRGGSSMMCSICNQTGEDLHIKILRDQQPASSGSRDYVKIPPGDIAELELPPPSGKRDRPISIELSFATEGKAKCQLLLSLEAMGTFYHDIGNPKDYSKRSIVTQLEITDGCRRLLVAGTFILCNNTDFDIEFAFCCDDAHGGSTLKSLEKTAERQKTHVGSSTPEESRNNGGGNTRSSRSMHALKSIHMFLTQSGRWLERLFIATLKF